MLSRDGGRVLLAIRTRTYSPGENLSSFVNNEAGPAREIGFEPGEPLKFDVPEVGMLTLTGEWLDHMPILGTLDPGPNELRFSTPLLVKDKTVVGDLSSKIGIFSQDDSDRAMAFYIPREGRFLISQLQMKGAVKARVTLGRISFEEGGHAWVFVNGVPVCRADHLWVLHQPNFKSDDVGVSNPKLVKSEPGIWVPQEAQN